MKTKRQEVCQWPKGRHLQRRNPICSQNVQHITANQGCFKSVWKAVYPFWAHLIWNATLGKARKNISCKCFLFSIPKKCTILIMLDTLIETLAAFNSQTVLALQTDRLTNPRIRHQNNFINQAGKIIWAAIAALIFLEQVLKMQIRKRPYQMNLQLQKCLPFLFTSRKSYHSRKNATEEQLKNAYLTHYLKQRCQQICQQMESSTASIEILTLALILVYHNRGNKVPTTFRDNLTWICLTNDFLYFLQYLYII